MSAFADASPSCCVVSKHCGVPERIWETHSVPCRQCFLSAIKAKTDLNHCPTRVNITANRLEVPAVGDSLYNGFISND